MQVLWPGGPSSRLLTKAGELMSRIGVGYGLLASLSLAGCSGLIDPDPYLGTVDPGGFDAAVRFAADPSLLDGKGAAVEVKGARRAVEVEAMVGAGPSRSQTIWEASVRGFATRGYRRAWEDYSSVSDEVMERDAVPPGYRWFVKRYFQLIRPRR